MSVDIKKLEDLSVLLFAGDVAVGSTLRMALRGAGLRTIQMVSTPEETVQVITDTDPDVMLVHVGLEEADSGLRIVRFIRRWDGSPKPRIPIVAVSPRRDLTAINAVLQAGVHEFTLFPTSADELQRKLLAAVQVERDFVVTEAYVGPSRRRGPDPEYRGPARRVAE
jgi:CheY-like chemotaxis protein